jgi:hypothetical protein
MQQFVPSQVRDFIDERLPAAREQMRGGQAMDIVGPEYVGALAHIVYMIDRIPEHLLFRTSAKPGDFGEPLQAIRAAVDTWRSGNQSFVLRALIGRGAHPVSLLRRYFDSLPDEGPGERNEALAFIDEGDLRQNLETDIRAVEDAIDRRGWKSATVLGGSVIEALLLSALLKRAEDAHRAAGSLPRRPPTDLHEWTLDPLTEVARSLKIVSNETADLCRTARNYRNLIHPGRNVRLSQSCDRGTALAVLAAIERVMAELRGAG